MLAHIFEMFNRGNRTSEHAQGGLGIGLALARRLAEMHGGSIQARSDGPGKGSEFTVRLPLTASEPQCRPPGPGEGERLSPRRILIVDDNRDAADSLGMLLKFLGADVQTAHNGPDALAAFDSYRPSVVLLDIGMPDMDGYEVARRIRKNPAGHGVPLIALTGRGREDDRKRAREAGFDHHLIKPADIATLQSLMATLQANPKQGSV